MEWDAISDVWGNAVDIFNPYKLRQPIRMQGQHVDEESRLHYNRHRYYDPALGRYITQDPIGLRGGWNGYQYTQNPTAYTDPLGLCVEDLCIIEGGIALAVTFGLFSTATAINNQQGGTSDDIRDKAGLKVSPSAEIMSPPGNCTPNEQGNLQNKVTEACKSVSFSCKGVSDMEQLIKNRDQGRQCAISRDKINNKCFSGGNKGHRDQAIDAWNSVASCENKIGAY